MSNWNNNFTQLLRTSRPTLWGNWALNTNIKPGVIGIVDSKTGFFTSLGDVIPGASINENPFSQKWDVRSTNVTEKKTNIELDGSVTDPTTGEKITAGVDISWGFKNEGSIISTFSMSKEASISKFTDLIKNQMKWLEDKAKSANMTTKNGIVQGFCVITDVIYAKSGLNVGANSNNSSFSIKGTASGVNEMIGNSVSGKGSYVSTTSESSTDSHLWPSEAGALPTSDIPIAFAVASFEGDFLIPNWTHLVSSYELILDNTHGGTYIAHGKLSYDVDGKSYTKENSASGAMKSAIRDIPINAKNLEYEVSFTASNTKKIFKWGSPINQWQSGFRHVDVKGVWPGSPSLKDREA